jgi:hypothetical protein
MKRGRNGKDEENWKEKKKRKKRKGKDQKGQGPEIKKKKRKDGPLTLPLTKLGPSPFQAQAQSNLGFPNTHCSQAQFNLGPKNPKPNLIWAPATSKVRVPYRQ